MSYSKITLVMVIVSSIIVATSYDLPKNYSESFKVTWGRVLVLRQGQLLNLNLDKGSGSSVQSKTQLLYGKFDMQIKLVNGDSAGTVTAFYLSSEGSQAYDEIGFNFLGGQPYTVQTNVVTQGKGDRIQQFRLWFDPTKNFHTYSILWNKKNIIFYADTTPIRVFKNMEPSGVPYPNKKPMRIRAGIWKAATSRVGPDWRSAPFRVYYKDYSFIATCLWSGTNWQCDPQQEQKGSVRAYVPWVEDELDPTALGNLRIYQNKFMTYNYCTDRKLFSQGLPTECK